MGSNACIATISADALEVDYIIKSLGKVGLANCALLALPAQTAPWLASGSHLNCPALWIVLHVHVYTAEYRTQEVLSGDNAASALPFLSVVSGGHEKQSGHSDPTSCNAAMRALRKTVSWHKVCLQHDVNSLTEACSKPAAPEPLLTALA